GITAVDGGSIPPISTMVPPKGTGRYRVVGLAAEGVSVQPIALPANQPAGRFYAGGDRIAAFRANGTSVNGNPVNGNPVHGPEDWVASTTTIRGHATLGLTIFADGTSLGGLIAADPIAWLGAEHLAAFGADTRLLVKLLDAGQRLPIHAHPHSTFAFEHLGALHGKAEAWYLLSDGEVFLGLRRDVAAPELATLVETQDVERMLGLMHRIPVTAGQTVYVPPGVLHAIGAGILLVELQEPEDLSILLEWRDFDLDGAADGHLGLGFGTALAAVETRARSAAEIAALIHPADAATRLPAEAAEYFRLDLLTPTAHASAGFAVLVVIDGTVQLAPEHGSPMTLPTGSTVVVPHAAGSLSLDGDGAALLCRPPLPR
ncbi:MAG: class I mannose-6-phosphate isomerase, partial [Pseudolysinimonas sp.]